MLTVIDASTVSPLWIIIGPLEFVSSNEEDGSAIEFSVKGAKMHRIIIAAKNTLRIFRVTVSAFQIMLLNVHNQTGSGIDFFISLSENSAPLIGTFSSNNSDTEGSISPKHPT